MLIDPTAASGWEAPRCGSGDPLRTTPEHKQIAAVRLRLHSVTDAAPLPLEDGCRQTDPAAGSAACTPLPPAPPRPTLPRPGAVPCHMLARRANSTCWHVPVIAPLIYDVPAAGSAGHASDASGCGLMGTALERAAVWS